MILICKPLNFSFLREIVSTICSREIFTKKCPQQQNFDSDPKEAWHFNHVTFAPIAKHFMLYCRFLVYMLSVLHVRLTIKVLEGGDTRELQSRMVPSQNNWVESP